MFQGTGGTLEIDGHTPPPNIISGFAIGDTIAENAPSAGAGNIESPGSDDEYAFTGTAGQVIRFNDPVALACCWDYW